MSDQLTGDGPSCYVAIGASAGGLEALQEFFQAMPCNTGAAFIVIQHLSPDFKSMMAELLGRKTQMKIFDATDGTKVEPNTVYLNPPRKNMLIAEGRLILVDRMPDSGPAFTIDIFYRSIAEDQHHRAIAIILSGTGSDGSRGIAAVKEVGGLVMVQEPATAKFDGMPYSAIKTGMADVVAAPTDMPAKLIAYINHPLISGFDTAQVTKVESDDAALAEVFLMLKACSTIDFSQYKTSTVARRIERRIGINQLENLTDYHALLKRRPQELNTLAKDMLIGVTRFFRDTEVFDTLEKSVIPAVLSSTPVNEPLRIWVAGCSSGEEAYSIAILFDEVVRQRGEARNIKIFATDVDPDAIAEASAGQFSMNIAEDITEARLSRYFSRDGDLFAIVPNIRQTVIFATHNLIKDPPFSNINLALCRNVLIYFQPEAQRRVLSMLHFSLQKSGYLCLGGSESLGDLQNYFEIVNERNRIFQKTSSQKFIPGTIASIQRGQVPSGPPSVDQLLRSYQVNQKPAQNNLVVDELISDYVPPCIVLNENHEILHVYGDVSQFTRKIKSGRFSSNIEDIIAEPLSIALSTALHRAQELNQTVQYDGVELNLTNNDCLQVNLRVKNIKGQGTSGNFFVVIFEKGEPAEKTANTDKENTITYNAFDQSQQRIKDLESQLQKKQEHLQVTVEELETTNEELQSSNEELMAANEELQSTNEELQSVNEELFTVNSEYQLKFEEMTQLNADLDNIMKATNIGIIFLDDAMMIRNFTPAASQEINLMPSDLGRPFHHIAHNLMYDTILKDIAEVIEKAHTLEREVHTKQWKSLIVRLSPYYDARHVPHGCVISITDITETKMLQTQLSDSYKELRATVNTALLAHSEKWRILLVDDDEVDRMRVKKMLRDSRDSNCEVVEAEDAARAKHLLSSEAFDVCFIDYWLGDETAFELIKSLSDSLALPPFIMLSGVIDSSMHDLALKLGIYDSLEKSVLTSALVERCIRYTMRNKQTELYLAQMRDSLA